MRVTIALMLLGILGFAAAGCASAKKLRSTTGSDTELGETAARTIAISGRTAMIPNVKTGTPIRCKDWPPGMGLEVPPLGQGVTGSTNRSPSKAFRFTHLQDGSVVISCGPPH